MVIYDTWLMNDADWDRFHGFVDEEAKSDREWRESIAEDEAMEEYYERKYGNEASHGTKIDQ